MSMKYPRFLNKSEKRTTTKKKHENDWLKFLLALTLRYILPFSCFLNTLLATQISGFPIIILVVDEGALPPAFGGGAPGVGSVGSN